jgi:hypothetical protein
MNSLFGGDPLHVLGDAVCHWIAGLMIVNGGIVGWRDAFVSNSLTREWDDTLTETLTLNYRTELTS